MRRIAAIAVLTGALFPSASLAADVRLYLSGSAFDGGPAYEILLGKKPIGQGLIDPVPATGQAIPVALQVEDALFEGNPELRIRLTNDAYGGPGQDRNLYIYSLEVDGRPVPLDAIQIVFKGEHKVRRLKDGHLDIWSSQEQAVARAPSQGWLSQGETAEAVLPSQCTGELALIDVSSSAGLTPEQRTLLQPIVAASREGYCMVTILGYASPGGTEEANRTASMRRGQFVRSALEEMGVATGSAEVLAMGATSQFGEDPVLNQRVVVQLSDGRG